MSPLRIVAVVATVLCYGAAAALCVVQYGWRRGLVRFADVMCWSLVVIGGPRLVGEVAGDLAAWCALLVFVAAAWCGGAWSLGLLNFLVLQWFGVRLSSVRQRVLLGDDDRCFRHVRWTILRWVWPLTGWWSAYRWIARRP